VTFKASSYEEPTSPNCLDLSKEYHNMWLHSIKIGQGNQTMFNEYGDPFGLYGNIISMTNEV